MSDLPSGAIARALELAGIDVGQGRRITRNFACIFPDAHKHADRRPSAWLNLERNLYGCPTCGTFSAKKLAELLNVDWSAVLTAVGLVKTGKATSTTTRITGTAKPAVRRVHVEPPAVRPRVEEVRQVLAGCTSVADDLELRRQLQGRAIDPALVADRGLAYALPGALPLPRWARYGARSWAELGHRLVVPMYDAGGALVTLHGRRLTEAGDGTPKGLSAKDCSHAGAVFADPLARLLLAGDLEAWADQTVIVAEGVPDFLTNATFYGDDTSAPAIFGVISGSWSQAIADRIPDGAKVIIRTHDDAAGIKYRNTIGQTLCRRCELFIPAPTGTLVQK